MSNLRIVSRNNSFVIQNYEDNRKQWGKKHSNITAAKKTLRKLIADVATKKVIISDRYKFKEEYQKFANWRLEIAEDKTLRLAKGSIQGYDGNYHKYIADCFPDVYIDQVDGSVLEEFVTELNKKKKDTFTGQSMWKKSKDLIYKIKTFLRYADGKKMYVDKSVFNWHMKDQYHLQPEDDALFYPLETTPIMPDEVNRLLAGLLKNRNKDFKSFYKLMTVAGFLFTGLRFSELLGLQKKDIDLIHHTIWIGGVYDHRENRYKNKTKKKASKRTIDIQDDFLPILTEWMKKIKDLDNPCLFPSLTTKKPISSHAFRSMLWITFEEYGLAKLKWKVCNKNNLNGKRNPGNRGVTKSYTIISSPFKHCPTKTFRHSLATHLVNAVKSDRNLDTNYIKNVLGHGDYRTTESIYGNHVMRVTDKERAARRLAVKKAMKLDVSIYFNKQKLIKK